MDRGAAMLAVVLDIYEGGKDLIPGWKLKEHAESALATRGVEGLRRYYEACLTGSDHRVKTTLESETKDFGIGARAVHGDVPGSCPAMSRNDDPALAAAAGGQVIERWIGELRAPEEFEKTRQCSLALRPKAVGAEENVVPDPRDSLSVSDHPLPENHLDRFRTR